MSAVTIQAQSPVRNAVSSLSSGAYYERPRHWWEKLCDTLQKYGYDLNDDDFPVFYSEEGRGSVSISKEGEEAGRVIFTWYRMPSFNWEIICYLA